MEGKVIWDKITEYMVQSLPWLRGDIKKEMAKVNDGTQKWKGIYDRLGTEADCSCNGYVYSCRALFFIQKAKKTND